MATVLITGANRGLGLEFVKQYAEEHWRVIACCRQPSEATDLMQLSNRYPAIQVEMLDIADFSQIDSLANKLAAVPIDVLLNNAGVYGDERGHGFGNLDYATWNNNFTVNTQAPVKMAEAFLSNLKSGKHKLIVSISSLMGSIADNTSGGSILYRSSKAALNAAMKSLALDLEDQGIGVLILHPGWVITDMGGPNALISPTVSVAGMRKEIADFAFLQTGSFLKYDGTALAW